MRYTPVNSNFGCCAVESAKTTMGSCYGKENLLCCTYQRFPVKIATPVTAECKTADRVFALNSSQQQAIRQNAVSTLTSSSVTCRQIQKKVRFADDEGGLLCSVKIFEEKPFVYQPRLHTTAAFSKTKLSNYTVVYNETKLFLKQVCLVSYGLVGNSTLFGAIAVRNIAFQNHVKVRLTLDGWKTSFDVPAKFVQQEFNGRVDRFFFMHPMDESDFEKVSSGIEFAVCYSVNDSEYWDNNSGDNYQFSKKS